MSITDFIINDIKPVAETAPIGEVQTIFSQTTHSHVPIHRDSVYVGCLAENDTHCYDSSCKISDHTHAYEHFFVRYDHL